MKTRKRENLKKRNPLQIFEVSLNFVPKDSISVNFWFYPLKEVSCFQNVVALFYFICFRIFFLKVQARKFDDELIWNCVSKRELESMILQSPHTHELVLEANLFSLYTKFNRGGSVDLEIYESHKSKLVDIVQTVLKKKIEMKKTAK